MLVVAALVAAMVLVSGGGGGSSLVARAYAAIRERGMIIHFVEIANGTPNRLRWPVTARVWIYGRRSRVIVTRESELGGRRVRLSREIVIDGAHETVLQDGRVSRRSTVDSCVPLLTFCAGQIANPLDAISALYKSGRLHAAGHETMDGHRLDVLTGTVPAMGAMGIGYADALAGDPHRHLTVRLLLDARTALPMKITETNGLGWKLTASITDYKQLRPKPKNRRLLTIRPHHPHADRVN